MIAFCSPDLAAMQYVCEHLRDVDRHECFATRFHDNPKALAAEISSYGPISWVVFHNDEPVAALGAVELWPGHWNVWAFGTDQWPKVVKTITKHISRVMIPGLAACGARTAGAYVHADHEEACRWLAWLGASPTPLENWGKNGEKFILYRWFADAMAGSSPAKIGTDTDGAARPPLEERQEEDGW
jgi:hypothetical protein